MSYFLDFGEFDLGYLVDLHLCAAVTQAGAEQQVSSARTAGLKAVLLRSEHGSTVALARQLSETTERMVVAGTYRPAHAAELQESAAAAVAEGAKLVDLSACAGVMQESSDMNGVFDLLHQYEVTLTTGSLPASDTMAVVEAAQAAGLAKVLVPAVHLPRLAQAGLAVEGVFFEWTLAGLHYPADPPQVSALAQAIRNAGIGASVIASGIAPDADPAPLDALSHFLAALAAQGLSVNDLRQMAAKTPGHLLGLPERPRKLG
jgi:hypothetical protein